MEDNLKSSEHLVKELTSLRQRFSRMKKMTFTFIGAAEKSLGRALEWQQAIFEGSRDAIFISDQDSRFVAVNNAACDLTGYSREQLLKMQIPDLHDQPDLDAYAIYHQRILDGEEFLTAARILRNDGTKADTEFNNRGVSIAGKPYMHTTARDITERKRAEEALRESEARLELFFRQSLDGFFFMMLDEPVRWDENVDKGQAMEYVFSHERITKINDAMLAQYGATRERFLGLTPNDLFAHDREQGKRVWRQFFDDGRLHVETLERRFDGTPLWIKGDYICFYDSAKRIIGHFGIQRDITERKRAEEGLKTSEKRFRDIADHAQEWIWEVDAEGKYTYASQVVERILGYTPEEVLQKHFYDLFPPDDRESLKAVAMAAFTAKQPYWAFINRHVHKNGQTLWLETSGLPLIDEKGNLLGYRGVDTNITGRRQIEEEKTELEAQLRQAQRMESVGRLAGGVAHGFNNMLGVILGRTEMALEKVDPAQPLCADLAEIRDAAKRSADLTRQLLTFAHKQIIAPKVLDLNDTVTGMLKMLPRLIGENIQLNWRPGAALWPVKVDPAQVDQILANLCINARDAIAGAGRITIETGNITFDEDYCVVHKEYSSGDYVMLCVSDNGCGMDKATLGNIFDPFFTTKEMDPETGLGLPSVYGAVKQNNGFIKVYSEPGQGTTFRIYLPRHAGKAEQAEVKGSRDQIVRGGEIILLVDDEPALAKMAARMLTGLGYIVLQASTPGEAIRLAGEHAGAIDILLTDVIMPEMNGWDLAQNLLSLYPDLKRLFMSGYTADAIDHHGLLQNEVHFIQKPFSKADLASKIRQVLEA